jgi:EAL domain-containing protein (putative c-di-GMP-specific phosphodiesterase class I)
MEVIAEGVETPAQADALRALRCQRGQGFLYSRPLPAGEAGRLLGSGRSLQNKRPGARRSR